jgi:hypothetical protein
MYTTEVQFILGQHMWRVIVYKDNQYWRTEWFYTQSAADYYAARAELEG